MAPGSEGTYEKNTYQVSNPQLQNGKTSKGAGQFGAINLKAPDTCGQETKARIQWEFQGCEACPKPGQPYVIEKVQVTFFDLDEQLPKQSHQGRECVHSEDHFASFDSTVLSNDTYTASTQVTPDRFWNDTVDGYWALEGRDRTHASARPREGLVKTIP